MIAMQFMTQPRLPHFGKPAPPPRRTRTVRLSPKLTAKIEDSHVGFAVNGQEATWNMAVSGLPDSELLKIVRGIKLAE